MSTVLVQTIKTDFAKMKTDTRHLNSVLGYRFVGILVIILIMFTAGNIVYVYYSLHYVKKDHAAILENVNMLDSKLEQGTVLIQTQKILTLDASIQNLLTDVEKQHYVSQNLLDRVIQTRAELDNISDKVLILTETFPDRIGSKELVYLPIIVKVLTLADLYLTTLYDFKTAIRLLDFLIILLSNENSEIYQPIKVAITEDKQSVLAVYNFTEIGKIWHVLDHLKEQIDKFTYHAKAVLFEMPAILSETQGLTGWRESLKLTWLELKSLIKVRQHHVDNPLALISFGEGIRKEQLRLLLDQIRWASLHHEQNMYLENIALVREILKEYFDVRDTGIEEVEVHLEQLADIDLVPKLPVLNSVTLVKEALKNI